MRVGVSEATDVQLDWMVASVEATASPSGMNSAEVLLYRSRALNASCYPHNRLHYCTCWKLGGPIIARECITVSALYAQKNPPSSEYAHGQWGAYIPCGIDSEGSGSGPTPLIAAMRCYVASKLGSEVDVPDELV